MCHVIALVHVSSLHRMNGVSGILLVALCYLAACHRADLCLFLVHTTGIHHSYFHKWAWSSAATFSSKPYMPRYQLYHGQEGMMHAQLWWWISSCGGHSWASQREQLSQCWQYWLMNTWHQRHWRSAILVAIITAWLSCSCMHWGTVVRAQTGGLWLWNNGVTIIVLLTGWSLPTEIFRLVQGEAKVCTIAFKCVTV